MSAAFTLPFVVILVGAFLAVTRSNILHAVFGLAISLVGVAGAFLVLGSPFVAVMEVLIYVGGISVTMIFAVMLSSVTSPLERKGVLRKVLGALAAGLFFLAGALVIVNADFGPGNQLTPEAWSLEAVGANLLERFNLAFEVLSLVLLLAIVGAIVIVRKEPLLPADEAEPSLEGKSPMSLEAFLLLALALFSMGLYAVLARRNLIAILIGVELMLNAASINFLAFNYFLHTDPAVAQIVVLFIIGLAAAEAAIALAIILKLYRQRHNIDVNAMQELRG